MSSLAWTTIVLLVVLLPGFLFFVGLYTPERISRDKVQDSTIGRLAGVVLVSYVVHSVLILSNYILVNLPLDVPEVSLQKFFAMINLVGSQKDATEGFRLDVLQYPVWQFIYVMASASTGFGLGWVAGRQIINGHLHVFARHGWIYDLIAATKSGVFVNTYILTEINHEDRYLVYKGYLKDFCAAPDGKIAYVVLKDCVCYYLKLGKKAPITSEQIQRIGETSSVAPRMGPSQLSYLIIEGEDIANVYFEAYKPQLSNKGEKELNVALETMRKHPEVIPDVVPTQKKPKQKKKPKKSLGRA